MRPDVLSRARADRSSARPARFGRQPLPVALLLALCTLATPARAADDSGLEEWMRLAINGSPAGYIHTVVRPLPDGGSSTWIETRMSMARMGTELTITTEATQVEDAEGRVRTLGRVTNMSGDESRVSGRIEDGVLHVTIAEPTGERRFEEPWDPTVRGPEHCRRELVAWIADAQPGDTLEQVVFDLDLGGSTRATLRVEEVDGAMLSVSETLDRLPGAPMTRRVTRDGDTERLDITMMGLEMSMETCSREEALEALTSGGVAPEVFATTVLRPDHPLPRPRGLDRVLFRFEAKDPAIPLPDFASERQRVLESSPTSVLLEIRRVVPGGDVEAGAPSPGAEFLAANATIQSDDPEVIALAAELAGEGTPWERARNLERGVFRYIDKKSFGVAFATAAEVCRDRAGDCSEHAVLLAALARAEGIPSRVAMGLTYVGGIFGGHAWTEVWIDGRWIALDGTNGLGSVDAAHIRFGVSSLDGLGMGAEMFGALIGLANLDIHVLETESGGELRSYGEQAAAPFRVEGRSLTSHVYGFSVDAPEGYVWDAEDPHWMTGLLARAEGPDGQELRLHALAVGYDFEVDDLGGDADVRIPREADGRPALLHDAGGWALDVLDGDTVFHVVLDEEDEDAALEALVALAESLDFEDA